LTDHQDFGAGFLDGSVHHARVIVEDAKPRDFPGQPLSIFRRIRFFARDQDLQAFTNRRMSFSLDANSRFGHSLDHGTHGARMIEW
jgi:hypothetical protein